ncbi:MAG: metallophosphoesterase [Armatimonadetes bacterium]|nr:metallophosphoesterase [Armatimonadota bacterium]
MEVNTILAIAGSGAAAGVIGYSMLVEQFNIQVRELDLSFPNLPPGFDGYSILHLSDLHLTKLGLLEKRTMEIIGSHEFDACLITGDVTKEPRASDIFRRVCSTVRLRDGIYTVLGNSERKPWLDTSMLVQALSFEGNNILINSSTSIWRGDQKITLVGVDDAYSRYADVEAAFQGVDSSDYIIYMTHCPSTTPQGIDHGADLILAGHTHGGQVRFPGVRKFWTHMRANKRLNDGLYTPDDLKRILRRDTGHSVLFVSRGVGTSRIHIRLLCPPEIAFITLHRAERPA